MKSGSPYLVALLALALAGVGGFAVFEHMQLVALRSRVAVDDAALQKRLADASGRIKALRDQLAVQRRGSQGAAGDAAEASRGPTLVRGGPMAAFRTTFNDPNFQKLAAVQSKVQLDSRYADLFRALIQQYHLSAEQLDQLKNLLVQRQQSVMDAMEAMRDQGIDPRSDPATFNQALNDAQNSVDQQIQADLGDSAYSAYQQYQQTLPERGVVTQLQQALSYSSSPLTADQANQLISLLAQNAPAQPGVNVLMGPGGVNVGSPATPISDQAITQAQSFLSAAQVQALQQIQAAQQAQQQMMQMMRANLPPPPGAGGS